MIARHPRLAIFAKAASQAAGYDLENRSSRTVSGAYRKIRWSRMFSEDTAAACGRLTEELRALDNGADGQNVYVLEHRGIIKWFAQDACAGGKGN